MDVPAFVSCHMPIYEDLLFEGQYGVKGREGGGLDEWWEGVKGWGEFVVMVKGKASETIKNDLQFVCV